MEMQMQPVGSNMLQVVSIAIGAAVGVGLTMGAVLVAGGVLLEAVARF